MLLNLLVTTDEGSDIRVDWDFLECIYQNRNAVPTKVPEEARKNFKFDPSKYYDAVIMPWYRSQDQPQVHHPNVLNSVTRIPYVSFFYDYCECFSFFYSIFT